MARVSKLLACVLLAATFSLLVGKVWAWPATGGYDAAFTSKFKTDYNKSYPKDPITNIVCAKYVLKANHYESCLTVETVGKTTKCGVLTIDPVFEKIVYSQGYTCRSVDSAIKAATLRVA